MSKPLQRLVQSLHQTEHTVHVSRQQSQRQETTREVERNVDNALGGSATTDDALEIGNAIYVKASGNVGLAQADSLPQAVVVGLATAARLSGSVAPFRCLGIVERDDWTAIVGSAALTPGAWYFVSAATAGMLSETQPAMGVRAPAGYAISTTRFVVTPQIYTVVATEFNWEDLTATNWENETVTNWENWGM
jgi:hypothetical protein